MGAGRGAINDAKCVQNQGQVQSSLVAPMKPRRTPAAHNGDRKLLPPFPITVVHESK